MTAFRWHDCQWPWAYFKVIGLFHIKCLKNGVWYGKSYCRLLIGNHTLAFDWCHFWWPSSTLEGHFSLGCHFGPIPYRPQTMSATTISATTIPATKHDHISHKVYKVGFVVQCFCLYPSCSGGSLFRTFMMKIKRIKIRWKARSWGRLKMRDMKV